MMNSVFLPKFNRRSGWFAGLNLDSTMEISNNNSIKGNKRILNSQLKKIYSKHVKVDNVVKKRVVIVKKFLSSFKRQCLDICPIFAQVFKRYHYTGSAFEGLLVKDPDEFDVNIVLQLACIEYSSEVQEVSNPSSFATYRLRESIDTSNAISSQDSAFLSCFFDEENYLIGAAVLRWLQSLIDHCIKLPNFQKPVEVIEVRTTNSGPARTLKLTLADSAVLSLDLVPVLLVNCQEHPLTAHCPSWMDPKLLSQCFLVPKPLTDFQSYGLSEKDASKMWRIHFAEAEKEGILERRHILKPIIKLTKRLRDANRWPLPSYFIKMAAFWMVDKHPDRNYFENEGNQGMRFLELLETLLAFLHKRHLGHIFHPDFNLLQRMNPVSIDPICNRLKRIIDIFRQNPKGVQRIFRTEKHCL